MHWALEVFFWVLAAFYLFMGFGAFSNPSPRARIGLACYLVGGTASVVTHTFWGYLGGFIASWLVALAIGDPGSE